MNYDKNTIIWFFVATIFASIPVALVKYYTISKNIYFIFLAIISYLILIIAYINILDGTNISAVYPLLKIFSVIIVILFGLVTFNITFKWSLLIGIFLAIISMYMLSKNIG